MLPDASQTRRRTWHGEARLAAARQVRLIQGGYPTRIPFADVHLRYKDMLPSVSGLPEKEFCELIAEVCGIGRGSYALGLERMFFKQGAAAVLEELSKGWKAAMRTAPRRRQRESQQRWSQSIA